MKSLSYLVVLISMILLLVVPTVGAQTVSGLYSAKLPVPNQSVRQRDKVMSQLLARVLVKVSGYGGVLENLEIRKQLARAISYTVEFNFSRLNGQLQLTARFNEQLVDRLLKSAGVSIWGTRRPSVMLWLAYQDQQFERHIISENLASDYSQLITRQASYRGLPMLLPIWDLDDQLRVDITDIWGLFSDKVALANLRYHSDFMIIAKVSQLGVSHRINWVIYKSPNNVDAFDIQPAQIIGSGTDEFVSVEQALLAIVNQGSDFFSRQYSVDTMTDDGQLVFNVANIESIDTYVAVSDYLLSLKAVESLQVTQIENKQFTFTLNILGDSQSLLDVISLEKKLLSDPLSFGRQPLLFQWHQSRRLNSDLIGYN